MNIILFYEPQVNIDRTAKVLRF